jgi:phage terminase large subunit-like protein
VAIFGDADDGFDLLARFWLPEANIVALERKHRVPYRAWADAGWITLTEGNVIDYGFIRARSTTWPPEYDLRKLLIDPFNATKLASS